MSISERPTVPRTREPLWDAIKAIALVRVIAWHTWAWAPLTWLGAMPAMFLANGALLEHSLTRLGWATTARRRLRRLLVPYWLYATSAVAVMVAGGWRPTAVDLTWWVAPLVNPTGPPEFAALWVPLWYLRTYLWFVLAAGVLHRLVRVAGWWAPVAFAGAALGLAPLLGRPVGDFLVFGAFVTGGMAVIRRGAPSKRRLAVVAASAAVAWAVGTVSGRFPVASNTSYTSWLVVGIGTCALLLGLAPLLRHGLGRASLPVALLNRRALSVYLWHGFGLLAADRLVWRQDWPPAAEAIAAAAVVVAVTVVLASVAGPVEDRAARRRSVPSHRPVHLSWARLPITEIQLGSAASSSPDRSTEFP